jgi:HK97 family phage portal protein
MKISFEITKAVPPASLQPVLSSGWWSNWFGTIAESFTGAWQRNVEVRLENVLSFSTVYACVTLIASDIGKLHLRYVTRDNNGIWKESESPAFSPFLRKPNRYQTRQKFVENWMTSKLIHGNTYVLKERDERQVVVAGYVLDPLLTKPMITEDGQVWYSLTTSRLAGVDSENGSLLVPASEIFHDVNVPLYHPLCGVSPITACGLAALQGVRINENSVRFFESGSRPGGILTAPALIDDTTAKRVKEHWDNNFTGVNAGKVAVLGDGLKYESLAVTAVDADLINQLKMSSEQVCSAFHVPGFMVNVGQPPSYNNIEALYQMYYSQCLQTHIEGIEAVVDNGLGLIVASQPSGVEFDLDDLLRMDTATQYRTYGEGVARGILAPNEARKKINLPPKKGGDTPYLQQQNYSLEALDKRDSKEDPFNTKPPAPAAKPPAQVEPPPPQKLLAPPDWSVKDMVAAMMVAQNRQT